jgi:hypothetical protein
MERRLEENGSGASIFIVVAGLEGLQGCQTGSNARGCPDIGNLIGERLLPLPFNSNLWAAFRSLLKGIGETAAGAVLYQLLAS